jgi:hypothetical protein
VQNENNLNQRTQWAERHVEEFLGLTHPALASSPHCLQGNETVVPSQQDSVSR